MWSCVFKLTFTERKTERSSILYTKLRKEQISVRIEPVTISNDHNNKAVTPRGP
jgi:hypothetical protein